MTARSPNQALRTLYLLFFAVFMGTFSAQLQAAYTVTKSFSLLAYDSPYLEEQVKPAVFKLKFHKKVAKNPEYELIIMRHVNETVTGCRANSEELLKAFDTKFGTLELIGDQMVENIESGRLQISKTDAEKALKDQADDYVKEFKRNYAAFSEECETEIVAAIQAGWTEVQSEVEEYRALKLKVKSDVKKANFKLAGAGAKLVGGIAGIVAGAVDLVAGSHAAGAIGISAGVLSIGKSVVEIREATRKKAEALAKLVPDVKKAEVALRNATSGLGNMEELIRAEMEDLSKLNLLLSNVKADMLRLESEIQDGEQAVALEQNQDNKQALQEGVDEKKQALNRKYAEAYTAQKNFMDEYVLGTSQNISKEHLKAVTTALGEYRTQRGLVLRSMNEQSLAAEDLLKQAVKQESEYRKLASKKLPEQQTKKEKEGLEKLQAELKNTLKALNTILLSVQQQRAWRQEAADWAADVDVQINRYKALLEAQENSINAVALPQNMPTDAKPSTKVGAVEQWLVDYGKPLVDITSGVGAVAKTVIKVVEKQNEVMNALELVAAFVTGLG